MTAAIDLFALNDVAVSLGSDSTVPEPLSYRAAPRTSKTISKGTYEPYTVQRIAVTGARRHGTALVESASLATVRPPFPKYHPKLEPALVSKGLLSLEQLEAIIYAREWNSRTFQLKEACEFVRVVEKPQQPLTVEAAAVADRLQELQRYTVEVDAEYRYGFFCGDGTGVGKGRIAAGYLRSFFNEGHRRAVWLSFNDRLIFDARRDWADLGGAADEVVPWSRFKLGTPPSATILFGSYDTLGMERRINRRIDDLVAALGENFEGPIVLDEIHAAANADPQATSDENERESSRRGRAVLELQRRLPKAAILYISATGASRLDGLAYAHRLGLWGSHAEFDNRNHFLGAMDRGGTAALESLARDLKARGQFCSRHLSYEGVEYERVTSDLDPDQIGLFNKYVRVWHWIDRGIVAEAINLGAAFAPKDGSLELPRVHNSPATRARAFIGPTRQRFFAQVFLSLKMPTIIRVIEQALERGEAPVCQLTHTFEGELDRTLAAMDEDNSLDDLEVSHRRLLVDFVLRNYPIHEYTLERKFTTDGKLQERSDGTPVFEAKLRLGPDGHPIVSAAALARRDTLVGSINALVFPDTALDQLYAAFPGRVVENTGRSKVLLTSIVDGKAQREVRKRPAGENRRAVDAFNAGEADILVFSERAGGIGASYHASTAFRNQKRRVHIPLEMSWSAELALQALGRTNRTGQVVPPRVVFVQTSLPGEKRLTSTPARRIANLGAISRGQREAANNGLFRAEDNLETRYAEEALKRLFHDVQLDRTPGLTRELLVRELGIDPSSVKIINRKVPWYKEASNKHAIRMTQFLNRLMSCSVDLDGGMQQRIMDAFIERLEIVIDEAIAANSYDAGIETFRPHSLTIAHRELLNTDPFGARTELVRLAIEELPDQRSTWERAVALRDQHIARTGRTDAFFTLEDGEIALHIPRQSYDPTLTPLVRVVRPNGERTRLADPDHVLAVLPDADAQKRWLRAFKRLDTIKRDLWCVIGALTPVWTRLPAFSNIYRMQTDDGEILLGRLIHRDDVAETRGRFGLGSAA